MSVVLSTDEAVYLRELARQCRKTNDPNDVRRLANLIEYRTAYIDRLRRGQYVVYKPTEQKAKVEEKEDGTLKLRFKDGKCRYANENEIKTLVWE